MTIMKRHKIKSMVLVGTAMLALHACNKTFLEREPLSDVTPDNYLVEESQLAAYAINRYGTLAIFEHFNKDMHTDVQAGRSYDNRFVPGEWKVGQSGGEGSFTERSEEHTSELKSLMRISYAVFCLKNKTTKLHIVF